MSVQKPNVTILKAVNIEYCFSDGPSVFNIAPDSIETDAVFSALPFNADSITVKETSNRTNAGISYLTEIGFEYPGYRKENNPSLVELMKSKLIFRLTLDTGQKIIVGSPDFPARLLVNRNWKSFDFKNELSAKCNSVYPLLSYKDYIP